MHTYVNTHMHKISSWMQALANQCGKWTCASSSVLNTITHTSPCLYEAITRAINYAVISYQLISNKINQHSGCCIMEPLSQEFQSVTEAEEGVTVLKMTLTPPPFLTVAANNSNSPFMCRMKFIFLNHLKQKSNNLRTEPKPWQLTKGAIHETSHALEILHGMKHCHMMHALTLIHIFILLEEKIISLNRWIRAAGKKHVFDIKPLLTSLWLLWLARSWLLPLSFL